jgi:hypothetical protein
VITPLGSGYPQTNWSVQVQMDLPRRTAFGIVGLPGLLWFLARTENISYQRGTQISRATGLDAWVGRSFKAPMLLKGVGPQMRFAQAAAVRPGILFARNVSLSMSVIDFARTRSMVDQIVKARCGYMASVAISSPKDTSQALSANIAIPSAQCDTALDEFMALGRVEQERQGTEEVTLQSEDLDIPLKNAREAKSPLASILRVGTGKVSDVLAVEKEMARVR